MKFQTKTKEITNTLVNVNKNLTKKQILEKLNFSRLHKFLKGIIVKIVGENSMQLLKNYLRNW